MTQRLELYKCRVCNNIVQVLIDGVGELVCCGQPMELLQAHTNDSEFNEKHVPVFEKDENGNDVVKIGSVPHPMVDEHFIQFIEIISKDKKNMRLKYLFPTNEPMMQVNEAFDTEYSVEYCNIHGLWGNERGENDK